MIYVPAEVMLASVFTALHSRAPGQSFSSDTECHTVLVGSRVQLQETAHQVALDLVPSPAPQAYVERLFSLSGDLSLTARKWNILRYLVEKGISETEPSHSALNSMYCELKCAVSEMT